MVTDHDALIALMERVDNTLKRLYGEEQDKGDIPAIVSKIDEISICVQGHEREITRLRVVVGIAGALALSGIGTAISQLF